MTSTSRRRKTDKTMITDSPEFCLLVHALDDAYQIASVAVPREVDWERFERLVQNNKLAVLAYSSVLHNENFDIPPFWRARFSAALAEQEAEQTKFARSIDQVNRILGSTPYVLVKTYRPFLYHTHDVDVLVADVDAVGKVVTAAGIAWDNIPRGSVQIEEPQWLDLEFYGRVLPGSIQVIDDELTLANPIRTTLAGVETWVASPEIETVTLMADAALRLYELKLGDMIYIYSLAGRTDWALLEAQARKYGWIRSFEEIAGVLNSLHCEVYGFDSPIEQTVPSRKHIATVPYVPSWLATINALSGLSNRHLLKLASYLSVRLKIDHPRLHKVYVRFFQVPAGRFVLRYFYQ